VVLDDGDLSDEDRLEVSSTFSSMNLLMNCPQMGDAVYQGPGAPDRDVVRPASPASDADNLEVPAHLDPEAASLDDVKTTLKFINLVRNATLENGSLDEETILRLRNPIEGPLELDDDDFLLALEVFLATTTGSEDTYAGVRKAVCKRFPDTEFPSLDQLKKRIMSLTGVTSIIHDMCINSCVGYTGPFEDLMHCPICHTLRYDPLKYNAENNWKKVPL